MAIYDKIKIAVLSLNTDYGQIKKNLCHVRDLIKNLENSVDIAVLPELFSTGFIANKNLCQNLAEDNDGETISLLKTIAAEKSMAIAGSFLAKKEDKLYNRAFFIEPGGDTFFYDKRHLFMLSEEAEILSSGDKPSQTIRFRGWNISMAICYDIRFPIWCRNKSTQYDLLIVPANWPEKRSFAWTHLLQARAIENQAYVVGANRSGEDKYGEYSNQTYIFDYKGRDVSNTTGDITYGILSKEKLEKYREDFPVWKSADKFEIKL